MNKPIIIVEWIDASIQEGPIAEDEIAPICPHFSAGYLIAEDDEYLSIGLDYAVNENNWRYILHIPQAQITKTMKADSFAQVWRDD